MTCARRDIVNSEEIAVYHCVSRCVRRAFLCGQDAVSKRSFEHRRGWIRSRLRDLAQIFAVEIVAYAVMGNHLHLVVRTRPDIAKSWSEEEVLQRWRTLFPRRLVQETPAELAERQAFDFQNVELYRKRLSCLSWLNRCLNENIARRANQEDECTGRFWEGRFKCQKVCDLAGLIACAVYVDLNPIRAGIAHTPEESDHTSIQDRIDAMTPHRPIHRRRWAQVPLISMSKISNNTLTDLDYLKLVDETGRSIRNGKKNISDDVEPILERLTIKQAYWVDTAKHLQSQFKRMVGAAHHLEVAAKKVEKSWFQGIGYARMIFGLAPALP